MADIDCIKPHDLFAYKGFRSINSARIQFNQGEESKIIWNSDPVRVKKINTAAIWLKIAHNKCGWGSTLKNQKMNHPGCKMLKMKMAALFGRKLITSPSILFRKPCLGSKLGYSRSRNPFI